MKSVIKKIFWNLPISQNLKVKISQKRFEHILEKEKKYDATGKISISRNQKVKDAYLKYLLGSYKKKSAFYLSEIRHRECKNDVTLVAYYLTQFYPNDKNDQWWGKGTTEWNNVNQAIPQFVGHYQPRKPGELGYYDLRIKENMARQIELAHNYGVSAFSFYYYWFDSNQRLLERPLNIFLNNSDLNINFFYTWANENWTKRYSGTNDDILMKLTPTTENYKKFIHSIINDFNDPRYLRINGRPILSVYRPSLVPDTKEVLGYWRKYCIEKIGADLYLIAVQEKGNSYNWQEQGYDAETEFQPKSVETRCTCINDKIEFIRNDFKGTVYDYKDLVEKRKYLDQNNEKKMVYPAVTPMWDNTARRNFRGTIYHGSTPDLYNRWLKDIISIVRRSDKLDKKMVFINAWNEWGEGAYLEPDEYFGYAYLEATWKALNYVKRL